MIEKISRIISYKLLIFRNADEINNDDLAILQYGLECIINTLIPIIIFLIVAFHQHMIFDLVLWLITFLITRNYIGGYHAKTHLRCIFISTITGLTSLFFIQYHKTFSVIQITIITVAILFFIFIWGPIVHDPSICEQSNLKSKAIKTILLSYFFALFFSAFAPKHATSITLGFFCSFLLYFIKRIRDM